MKKWWLTVILLLPCGRLGAEVPQLEGVYIHHGNIEILQVQSRKVIFNGHREGREKIQRLLNQGYECSHRTRQWWLCRKFLDPKTMEIPADMTARARKALKGRLQIEFGSLREDPTLVYQAHEGIIKEWSVPQEVAFGETRKSKFHYRLSSLSDGGFMGKIIIDNGVEYLHTPGQADLGVVHLISSERHELMVFYEFKLAPEHS